MILEIPYQHELPQILHPDGNYLKQNLLFLQEAALLCLRADARLWIAWDMLERKYFGRHLEVGGLHEDSGTDSH